MSTYYQIQARRDSAADWISNNPTLASGEMGYDETNETFKIGDGTTAWTSLTGVYTKFRNITVSSTDYTCLDDRGYRRLLVTTGNSNRTITLPTLADNVNAVIEISKVDSGTGNILIDGENAETINGRATTTLYGQYTSIVITATSSEWVALGRPRHKLTVSSADCTLADFIGKIEIDYTTGNSNRTLNLPTLADNQGQRIVVRKVDSGTGYITIDGENAETINGNTTIQVTSQYDYADMCGSSATWILDDYYDHGGTAAGYWCRRADGEMREWGVTNIAAVDQVAANAFGATAGNAYYGSIAVTFVKQFQAVHAVITGAVTDNNTIRSLFGINVAVTGFTAYIFHSTNTLVNQTVNWMAVGRWYA